MRSPFWRFHVGCRIALFCSLIIPRDSGAGLVSTWGLGPSLQPWNATNIVQIAAGSSHLLARQADGTLVAWGDNSYGAATIPSGLSNIVDIAAGSSFNLALLADGAVSAWGDNTYGALNVPVTLSNAVSVYAREFHALALCADGRPVAWGYNGHGEASIPAGLTNVLSIAAGYFHNLAIKADGTIIAWGSNNVGQTNCPPWLSNVTAVAAGAQFSMALTSSGRVVAWGDNSFHQTNVPPALSNVVAIAAGVYHGLALRADGTVVAWGEYTAGETNIPAQLSDVTALSAGDYYSAALTEAGPVQIMQNPVAQQILYGSTAVLQVNAVGSPPLTFQWLFNGQPLTNSEFYSGVTTSSLLITNARFIERGTYSVFVQNPLSIVQSTGALLDVVGVAELTLQPGDWTMGAGDNTTFVATAVGTPPLSYQWLYNGTPLIGATNTSLTLTNAQPASSGTYAIVVTNPYGATNQQLTLTVTNRAPVNTAIFRESIGNSSVIPLSYPVKLTSAAVGTEPLSFQWSLNGAPLIGQTSRVLSISQMSVEMSGYYSVVVSNALGSLETDKAEAWASGVFPWEAGLPLNFITRPPDPLTNVSEMAVGDFHLTTSLNDGSVVVWPLGFVPSTVTNVPYGLSKVVGVAAGDGFSLTLLDNGTVKGWGSSSGLQIPTNLNGVVQVAADGEHAAALRTNGTVAIWGFRYGSNTNQVSKITNAVSIAVGLYHGMALLDDGTVTVWGFGNSLPGLSNVVSIAAGDGTCLALRQDGTVVGWNSYHAGPPAGLSNVVAIGAGGKSNVGLLSDGTVKEWGLSSSWPPPLSAQLSNVVGIASGESFHCAKIGTGSPAFTVQPRSRSRAFAGQVTFVGFAAGSPPLSYQWYRNGTLLTAQTNTLLSLSSLSGADIGDYRLVVINSFGAATSAVATLSIPYRGTVAQALDTSGLVWTNITPGHSWFGEYGTSYDGVAAVQSAAINDSQACTLETTVQGPGNLSFWWKVSSEAGFDFLRFADNGSVQAQISGEQAWQQVTLQLGAGSHTLDWSYSKDASVSYGADAGWLDQVSFTPAPPAQALSALDFSPLRGFTFLVGNSDGSPILTQDLASIEIDFTSNLVDWVQLPGSLNLSNGLLWITDPGSTNVPHRFYRTIQRW